MILDAVVGRKKYIANRRFACAVGRYDLLIHWSSMGAVG